MEWIWRRFGTEPDLWISWTLQQLLQFYHMDISYTVIWSVVKNKWRSPLPRGGEFVRGHDKPILMGVAIAIDPSQVVYIYNARAPLTSVFEGQPPQNKAEIPIKTRGPIWVLGCPLQPKWWISHQRLTWRCWPSWCNHPEVCIYSCRSAIVVTQW